MANYIGSANEVDHYIDNNLVVAKYIGENKYYDAYSEIEGNLPLAFKARVAHDLTDYRIYGTESGAGVQTENINNKPIENGGWTNSVDGLVKNNYGIRARVGDIIVTDNTKSYTITVFPATLNVAVFRLNENGLVVGDTGWSNNNSITIDSSIMKYGIVISIRKSDNTSIHVADVEGVVVNEGSTAPTSYIPYGYELPLTVESGEQQSNYNLYIGDSKLGAEEYVDYGEQKVYKRTENLYNKDAGEIGKWLDVSTGEERSTTDSYTLTDYISVEQGANYFFNATGSSRCWFYDSNKEPVESIGDSSPYTPNQNGYARFTIFYTRKDGFMLIKGSSVPAQYIPYLQPTDPPVPFPPISTYKGENTLSSEETVGEVSAKGRIKEPDPLPEMTGIKAVFEYGGLSGTTWKNEVGANSFTWTSGNAPTDNGTEYVLSGNTFAKAGQYDSSDDYSGAVTMYLLAKFETVNGGYAIAIGGLENGYTYGIEIYASNTYGDFAVTSRDAYDMINPAVPANEYHVIAVTAASTDSRITVYGDGIKQLHTTSRTRLPRNYNGKAALYGMLPSSASGGNMHVKFVAFGNEKHTEEQIIANSQFIMSKYGIS